MSFCSNCGHPTETKIPLGDSLPREVCTVCNTIHYVNPKVICGALVIWEDKVLLCRRAIEPRYGLWTLPAGYMELFETMQEGAARETWEEAEAEIAIGQLYCMYNIPRIGQIYVLFKADLIDGQFGAGEETIECHLFTEQDVPWEDLAFPSVKKTLEHYFKDRKTNDFPLHLETIGTRIDQTG
ncbi:NUDIX hydrolase [Acinetobacter qingfengensis]|uniref:ADP-ribose pyrophosphatase n=1 Tax=Acinetobacter qingfengensis TaxID=1262585 RepID=A0A1E7RFE6_9GAMM|nr:NUDIX hydrolase [Acinetobacter qingfengensis]KAA8731853.1 NUDIX hydrolase [Acinetobacter qingfengensis]OEY98023.1 ADP-ribose pyrophosphatase [Acinetobacter qingfengensis]